MGLLVVSSPWLGNKAKSIHVLLLWHTVSCSWERPLNVSYIQRTKRIALMYNVPHLDITASYDRSTCPCSLTNIFSQTGQCAIGHRTFNILAEIPPGINQWHFPCYGQWSECCHVVAGNTLYHDTGRWTEPPFGCCSWDYDVMFND